MQDLTDQEKQYLIQAIDSYIRQTGVVNAAMGVHLALKIQAPAEEAAPESEGPHNLRAVA
jgi:hypothetical protein